VDRAVTCAIEMQMAMPGLNAQNLAEDLEVLSMGIGIHTGEVVVGNIGSELRAKYTVIGRHANIAARVETSATGDEIYISEATRQASTLPLQLASERRIHPKGIEHPLSIFRVVGIEGRDLTLPDPAGERATLQPPRRLSILQVRGKEISEESSFGELLAKGPRSVELKLETTLAPGSDLAMRSSGELVYAKVVAAGETVVAVLTGGDASKL
jgi:adenylate cyclase